MKTGRTGAYIIYARPDGEEGLCGFTVTVADVFYDVYIDDSCAENEMLTGDRADLKAVAGRYTDAGYTELGDDEIDVVWQTEPEDEEVPASDFTLLTDGSSATLIVTGGADPEEAIQAVLVRAHVYLKGTDEEIGSDEIRHSHVPSATVLVVKDTLPDDALEEGESFTITPSVIRRKELGSEVSEEREDRARFGLEFDPSQVRVTDQNGQEVEPAEMDDDDRLVESQADGVVYTVTRLTTEYIEISLTAVWPDGDGSDASCQRMAWKIFYLDSLEEDEPGEPSGDDEISPQGGSGSGRDKETAVPSTAGKSGKATSSSKAAKTNRTTKTSGTAKKTATGDASDAMLWILLMTASAFLCAAAAGSLRKKTR